MSANALRVGLIGCGLMGRTRVAALGDDILVAATDLDSDAATALVDAHGAATPSPTPTPFSTTHPTSSSSRRRTTSWPT